MTDKTLLAQYLDGSEEAFATIVARHTDLVYGACLRLLRDPGEAEDATQATFLLLVKKARSLSKNVVLSGWLYRSAVLVSRNAAKARTRRGRHEEKAGRMRDADNRTPDAPWEKVRPQLDAALDVLPAAQRDALILRFMRNQSLTDVARETGDSEAAISKRITRGLSKLRDLLRRQHLSVSSAALGGYLASAATEGAPAALGATIESICLGKAAASTAVTALTGSTLHGMFMAKVKMAVTAVVAAAALSTGAALTVQALYAPPAYYVDYANGRDDADGRSPANAFKHYPGDARATNTAAAVRLVPGDRIVFKGGVSYRGTVVIAAQGTRESPIIYDGNTAGDFGEGPAVIDGAEPLGPWTRCASPDEAYGHPDWKELYIAYLPAGFDSVFGLNLCAGDTPLHVAQEPNLDDPVFFEITGQFLEHPKSALKVDRGVTLVPIDANLLSRGPAEAWRNGSVLYPANAFHMAYMSIRSIVTDPPALGAARFGIDKLRDPWRHSVMNALPVLDRPGEYVVEAKPDAEGRHKVWLWPPNPGALARLTYATRDTGIELKDATHVTVDGFAIRRQGNGSKVRGVAGTARHTTISRCEVAIMRQWSRSGTRGSAIELTNGDHVRITGNNLHDNIGTAGVILRGGEDLVIEGNTIRRCGSTAIDVYGGRNVTVARNTITDHRAFYGNGITVARNSERILIEGNIILDIGNAVTLEDATTVTVRRNVLGDGIYIWGGPLAGDVIIAHNVLLDGAIQIGSSTDGTGNQHTEMKLLVANNILPSVVRNANRRVFSKAERTGNLYFRPDEKPTFKINENEKVEVDLNKIFAAHGKNDGRLRAGSPAIDAGVDISARNTFPDPTPVIGQAPDIGAYEFGEEKK